MSLLDDARKMQGEDIAANFDKECPFCGMSPNLHNVDGWSYSPDSVSVLHYPECPWLSMPKIVAALEAATHAVERWRETQDGAPDFNAMRNLERSLKGAA